MAKSVLQAKRYMRSDVQARRSNNSITFESRLRNFASRQKLIRIQNNPPTGRTRTTHFQAFSDRLMSALVIEPDYADLRF